MSEQGTTKDQVLSPGHRLTKLRMRLVEWEAEKLKDTPAAELADLFISLLKLEIAGEVRRG